MTTDPRTETASRILDIAEELVQTRGFNGFSYNDISERLGIRKPSIHHHFSTKAALGARLVERYRQRFLGALAAIDRAGGNAPRRLRGYARIYEEVLAKDRMCLCGMLAAEVVTLPESVRAPLQRFFDDSETWLTELLESGRRSGELAFAGKARDQARLLLASLEGAMMVARSYRDEARFRAATRRLVANLVARGPA
jgi:TetR/AcrR family transcriptional repressor of nem operon